MRLDALETKDMLTQRATSKKKREDGDKEGLLLEQRRKQYFTLEATLHSNHKSTSNTAWPIKSIYQRCRLSFLITCKNLKTGLCKLNVIDGN